MPKKINCPSCGANLKSNAYYCDYCGAFFQKPKNNLEEDALKRFSSTNEKTIIVNEDEDLYKKDNFESTEEIENSRLNSILISYNNVKNNNTVSGILFALLFFFIFVMSSVMNMPFIAILIVIIFGSNLNQQKTKKQELIKLYEKGAYEKAYNILLQLTNQEKISIIKQKIMLCYYRLNKKDEAINLINLLNSKPHIKDEHIKEVAQKLNVNYEPKPNFNL